MCTEINVSVQINVLTYLVNMSLRKYFNTLLYKPGFHNIISSILGIFWSAHTSTEKAEKFFSAVGEIIY